MKRRGYDLWWLPRRAEIARLIRNATDPDYVSCYHFRWQDDSVNGEDYDGDWLAAIDTGNDGDGGLERAEDNSSPFRLRLEVYENNNKGDGYQTRLEASYNGNSYFAVTTSSTYIKASSAANGTDGTTLTNDRLTPSGKTQTEGEFSTDGETANLAILNDSLEANSTRPTSAVAIISISGHPMRESGPTYRPIPTRHESRL
jgi:hypothetical protein